MNLNSIQKSAILLALQKAIKPEADQARNEANSALQELYEQTGADRVQVKLGEVEVGTFSLTFDDDGYCITDRETFDDFCITNGFAHEELVIKDGYKLQAAEELAVHCPEGVERRIVLDKGKDKLFKNIDGVFVVDGTNEVIPGIDPKPKAVKGAQMRGCKPEDVLPALKGLGVGVEQLLLGEAQ